MIVHLKSLLESESYCNWRSNRDGLESESSMIRFRSPNRLSLHHSVCFLFPFYFDFLCGDVVTLCAEFANILSKLLNYNFPTQCDPLCLKLFVTKVSAEISFSWIVFFSVLWHEIFLQRQKKMTKSLLISYLNVLLFSLFRYFILNFMSIQNIFYFKKLQF